MQPTTIVERREDAFERRHVTHKRMERWIRLQQFVYGLPEDYAYAICLREHGGRVHGHVLIRVGWLTWFGFGKGADRQHALALALLDTQEAWTSNGSRLVLFKVRAWCLRTLAFLRLAGAVPSSAEKEGGDGQDRLAG